MSEHDTRELDEATGTMTVGHEWDGIKELDTPLPRWWLWTFYITIVWGIAYTIAYPAWPLISGATPGLLGYSTRGELAEREQVQQARNAGTEALLVAASWDDVTGNPDLDSFARAGGAAVFRTYCSQCHGAGAAGAVGYPNLIDDAWLWGGSHDDIFYTVAHGIRWDSDDDSRYSEMPAFGADEILAPEEIELVADYILSLSSAAVADPAGEELYLDNCAACHGDNAMGDRDLGAPNLADAIWLYGGDRASVIETITYSRYGVMPAWNERLTEAEIKAVSHYVHSLGGGEE
ncbi:MAG: cytochrome-c oxidase, cbb3-type subunit III [Pseudomonadota bacterium]